MARLLDIINNNKSLRQVYEYLELGFHTDDAHFIQSCLNSFQIDSTVLTSENLTAVRKFIADEMESQQYSKRDKAEMDNIISVYGSTFISVQSEELPERHIDAGWTIKFYECVRNTYVQELQTLWSRILEIELKKPNTFFKRTLDVFFNADKFEIDWFYQITQFVFDKACIPEFVLTDNKFYPFNKFQTLVDAGFVNASLGGLSYPESFSIHLTSADLNIEVVKPPFGFSIYTLTDAGSQLFNLRSESNTEEYITKLKEIIEKSNTAKVTSVVHK